jgi:ABC-type xylose transport system permease subunit
MTILSHLLGSPAGARSLSDALGLTSGVISVLLIVGLEWAHRLQRTQSLRSRLNALPLWARWSVYYAFLALFAIFVLTQDQTPLQFIYFQF